MGQEHFLTFLWKSVVILILTLFQLKETCSSLEAAGFLEALLERGQAQGMGNWASITTQVIKTNKQRANFNVHRYYFEGIHPHYNIFSGQAEAIVRSAAAAVVQEDGFEDDQELEDFGCAVGSGGNSVAAGDHD